MASPCEHLNLLPLPSSILYPLAQVRGDRKEREELRCSEKQPEEEGRSSVIWNPPILKSETPFLGHAFNLNLILIELLQLVF